MKLLSNVPFSLGVGACVCILLSVLYILDVVLKEDE